VFMSESVNYLGHRIDQEGLHPTEEKLEAIRDAPKPRNVTELRSYLGLLTYYSKFLPNLASTLNPLYRLLLKSSPWHWGNREQKAFEASKQLLLSSQLLAHYDPQHALVLACGRTVGYRCVLLTNRGERGPCVSSQTEGMQG